MANTLKIIILAWLIIFAGQVEAYQLLQIREDKPVIAKISIKDPSRIAIKDGKIVKIRVKEEELTVEPDTELGEIAVMPKSGAENISVFIVDESNKTYSLLLQQEDIPAENIVLETPSVKEARAELFRQQHAEALPAKNYAYEKRITAILEMMAGKPKTTTGIEVKKIAPEEVKLWTGTRFFKVGHYQGQTGIYRGVEGDKYRLFNTSKERMVINEQEFFIEGVSAVSVENLELDPDMSTYVYVIKAEVTNE